MLIKSIGENETLDGILSGRKDFAKALEAKDPMLGWNGIGIIIPCITSSITNSYSRCLC